MLRQLVNVVGVAQNDIYVGDPLKHIYKHLYEVWHGEFPNVHYLDNSGYANLGREAVIPSTTAAIYYSDQGTAPDQCLVGQLPRRRSRAQGLTSTRFSRTPSTSSTFPC